MSLSATAAFSAIAGLFGDWLERRSRIKEAKTQAAIDRMRETSDQSGWKDEYLVVLWTIPTIMCFVPPLQPYVRDGFEILQNDTPEWYVYGLLGITGAVFGLKRLKKWKFKEK